MYWAYIKWYFRNNNEQSTNDEIVLNLILKSRDEYRDSDTNLQPFFLELYQDISVEKIIKTLMQNIQSKKRKKTAQNLKQTWF